MYASIRKPCALLKPRHSHRELAVSLMDAVMDASDEELHYAHEALRQHRNRCDELRLEQQVAAYRADHPTT
jgi:hypothetical protein